MLYYRLKHFLDTMFCGRVEESTNADLAHHRFERPFEMLMV